MRKIAFFAAVAATLCTVACNKNMEIAGQTGNDGKAGNEDLVEINLAISGAQNVATKTAAADFDDTHCEVDNVQFFVFNDNDELDAYKKITDGIQTTLTVRKGHVKVWAIVNADDITNVSNRAELEACASALSDNLDKFIMTGYDTFNIPDDLGEGTPTIGVNRLAARVVVKNITTAFTNPSLAGSSCKLVRMYLVNAPGNTNIAHNTTPSLWYCKQAYENVDGLNDFLFTSGGNHELNTAPFTTPCYHYCYPNPTTEDTSNATWSPRHTRMVVEVLLGSETFYYPITLPKLQAGYSYEIDNLTITRKGSSNPDEPVVLESGEFQISVRPWTVVPVTSGITI